MSAHHPHMPEVDGEEHHQRRPEWWSGISMGNVLTILTLLGASAGLYANNESRITKLETQQIAQDTNIATQIRSQQEMIVELRKANEKLDEKIEKVDDKIDQILLQLNRRSAP